MLNSLSLKLNSQKQVEWNGLFFETKIWIVKAKECITFDVAVKMES
jgi:hypothetical protein